MKAKDLATIRIALLRACRQIATAAETAQDVSSTIVWLDLASENIAIARDILSPAPPPNP